MLNDPHGKWRPRRAAAVSSILCLASLLGAPAQAGEEMPIPHPDWVPGQPYPQEGLSAFACHDYTLSCGEKGSPPVERVNYTGPRDGDAERGEQISLNVRWGNCLACHSLPDGHDGGTIGPSLADYGARGMPFEYTFQRIWDVRLFSPDAHMPVYGPNQVLTVQDILDVIAFIETGR